MKALSLLITFTLLSQAGTQCDVQKMQKLARDAQIIVVAEVKEVKPAMNIWSGGFLVIQRVRYKVKEVLKGTLSNSEINVGHYIIRTSLTVDTKKPRLSPRLFRRGNQLVLFLIPDSGTGYISRENIDSKYKAYLVHDPNCGAVLANTDIVNMIQRADSTGR